MNKKTQFVEHTPRKATFWEAIFTFSTLMLIMFVSIKIYNQSPHIPMFIGVIIVSIVALRIGYSWKQLENAMIKGINQAMQSIIILAIIGILVGVWILAGVVPTMIYYGLSILKPSIFLIATVLITSITSLATGTSWGTAGTMGVALLGIAHGMNIPAPVTVGAILSGAYFGDKMSPLSDTTNLAPAMAGTDVFSHVKAMIKPTAITYLLTLIFFGYFSYKYSGTGADVSKVVQIQKGLSDNFTINPILLFPPILVIGSIAKKAPAIPGIVLGIISAAILAPIFQGSNLKDILEVGLNGYVSQSGIKAVDELLTKGGLNSMMNSISLTLIAMMFGGIAEESGQLEAIVNVIVRRIHSATGLVTATILTCFASNVTMPEQYISIVVPGRMYRNIYRENGLHPKLLSSTLEAGGTVSSALIPWNTCGVYMKSVLGVPTVAYLPYMAFNIIMPIVQITLTALKQNNFKIEDDPDTVIN